MNRNQKIGATGAGALASLVTAGLLMSGLAAGQEASTGRSAPRSVASTADADLASRGDGWKATVRVDKARLGGQAAGQNSKVTHSGVPRAGGTARVPENGQAIVLKVPRRVTVTLPAYKPGRLPEVTAPSYRRGTDPSVKRRGNQVVVEVGRAGTFTPPTVRQGRPGRLTPPSVVVD